MNINKAISIHLLDEGYMVENHDGKTYGKETAEGVIDVIKKILRIEPDKIINELIPPVVI